MTLSQDDLKRAEYKLLYELSAEVGERYVDEVPFDPADSRFADYPRTSFPGLVRRMFARIVHTEDGQRFLLTPRGWMIGIKRADVDASSPDHVPAPPAVEAWILEIVKTLKGFVVGRRGFVPVRVAASDVESRSCVPRGWIRNSIESHMLEYAVPRKDVRCSYDKTKDEIEIPLTFQHPK